MAVNRSVNCLMISHVGLEVSMYKHIAAIIHVYSNSDCVQTNDCHILAASKHQLTAIFTEL